MHGSIVEVVRCVPLQVSNGEFKRSDAKKSNDSPLKRPDNHEYAISLKDPLLDRTPGRNNVY